MSLLALSSSPPPLPLPSHPPNRLYLFWNVYLCMCFRLLVEHNCSHLIFLRTCLQSSDNVLIANCQALSVEIENRLPEIEFEGHLHQRVFYLLILFGAISIPAPTLKLRRSFMLFSFTLSSTYSH